MRFHATNDGGALRQSYLSTEGKNGSLKGGSPDITLISVATTIRLSMPLHCGGWFGKHMAAGLILNISNAWRIRKMVFTMGCSG
jgi:hypothetical protein